MSAPSTPQNVVVTPVNSDKIYVSWSPSTDYSGTGLERYEITLTPWLAQYSQNGPRIVNPAKTQAACVDLPAGMQITVTVAARDNTTALSAPSAPVVVSMPPASAGGASWLGHLAFTSVVGQGSTRSQAICGTRRVILYFDAGQVRLRVFDGGNLTGDFPLPSSFQIWDRAFWSLALPSPDTAILLTSPGIVGELTIAPTGVTLATQFGQGTPGAWGGDCIALASGGAVAVYAATISGVNSLVFQYHSPSGAWSALTVTSPFGASGGYNYVSTALCQHPADSSIWCFTDGDASANSSIYAVRIVESSGGLSVTHPSLLVADVQSAAAVPHQEDPWLVARPNAAHGTIVLGYQTGSALDKTLYYSSVKLDTAYAGWVPYHPISTGSIPVEQNLAAPVGFVEIPAAIQYGNYGLILTSPLPNLPDLVERAAPWGDFYCDAAGNVNAVYANMDQTDMSRDMIRFRQLANGTWSAPTVVSEHCFQDWGQVSVLSDGMALFQMSDGTVRLVPLPVPAPPPPPPPTGGGGHHGPKKRSRL